jgi:hypothetical protein
MTYQTPQLQLVGAAKARSWWESLGRETLHREFCRPFHLTIDEMVVVSAKDRVSSRIGVLLASNVHSDHKELPS